MISPPSVANTAAPRICRVSASTTALMKPRDSAVSTARATQVIGILPTLSRRPSVRETIPNYPSVGPLYGEVVAALPSGSFSISVAIWHDPEYRESNVDAEAGFFLNQPVPAPGRIQVYELPPATVVSILHQGAYNRLPEAYDAVLRWVGSNGYQIAAPPRELYLQVSMPVRLDDESYITEIQVPVEKGDKRTFATTSTNLSS